MQTENISSNTVCFGLQTLHPSKISRLSVVCIIYMNMYNINEITLYIHLIISALSNFFCKYMQDFEASKDVTCRPMHVSALRPLLKRLVKNTDPLLLRIIS